MTTDTEVAQASADNMHGAQSSVHGDGSNADALRRKHEEGEAHKVRVEDEVDEEDLLHPPPSSRHHDEDGPDGSSDGRVPPMSAKAAGKQRAREDAPGPAAASDRSPNALDTTSHESFPELGSGLPARAQRPVTATWAAAKKTSPGGAGVNGASLAANGYTAARAPAGHASNHSSRASTPASSGVATPSSMSGASHVPNLSQSQRGLLPQAMSIPGRYTERISLLPQEMKPRSQLKKPVPDVLRDINKRSKANVQMASGAGGTVHFDARGPVDAVRQALKEVAKELGSKQSIKVSVPASVRPYIIGRQGTTVQAISQRTGASIQVPKPSDPADHDDDSMIDIIIEGDSVAAAMARREIEGLVDERTVNLSLKLKDIPAEFYPFLAGPHNSRVAALEEGKDLHIHIPQHIARTDHLARPTPSSSGEPQAFAPALGHPIVISGDRQAAQAARADLMARAEELRRHLTSSQLDINRPRHQFVLGERGMSLHDFLQETGCVVILPPETHDTETLTIIGPPESIENGINKVTDLAMSMQMVNLDISRLHPHAPSGPSVHARHLTRYLQHRRELERLEQLYDAHIAFPSSDNGPMSWEIYSREGKNMLRARTEIINIINGHPPARLAHINIDPFYHRHLAQQTSQVLLNEYGVQAIFPREHEVVPEVLLVYEGKNPDNQAYEVPKKQPTPQELQEFERALQGARQHLMGLIDPGKNVVSRNVDVPKKFHGKLEKFVTREQQQLPPGELPVNLQIEGARPRPDQLRHPQDAASVEGSQDGVLLRGHEESVDALIEKIRHFVAEEEANERERGYTLTFDFPQKFSNYLIGKKGENIRKYREEFDVEIQLHDGKVEIKGPKAKAEAAKARIVALGKKLEDEATLVLKIPNQYHKDLIGLKGSQVNRLQDRYNVHINFPRSAASAASNDNNSLADTASEVGGHKSHRPPQGQDEVIIKGPRKHADEARDELLSLLQWTIDNSYTAVVSVAQSQIPSLIGQGGREMEKMRMTTGAHIDVPDAKKDGSGTSGRVPIKLKGTKKQVEDAKKLLEERAKVFDESVTRTIEVDKKYHKALIGGGGSNIRDLVIKAGGPDDRRELSRLVRFPRPDSDDSTIRLEGNKAVVDQIVTSIEEAVRRMESEVVETLDVPAEQHRLLIGRGGETKRRIESQFHIGLDIPRQSEGPKRLGVKISGPADAVGKAKAHIQDMLKNQEGETIQIPRRLHHAISDNGHLFRRLNGDYKVHVDHGGHKPPPRPAAWNPRANVKDASMPLITDQDSSDRFSWQVRDVLSGEAGPDDEGDIPWILRGTAENVARARDRVLAALEQTKRHSTTGYLILPDPRTYRFVIGPGGSQVNSIRDRTGCRINVPKDPAQGEAIEIQGERDKVEQAKEIILEVVREGGGGKGGSGGGGRPTGR